LPPARRQRWALATRALLPLVADGRPRTVLDAGCGSGLFTLDLARLLPTWSFVGLDLAEDQLVRAEQARRTQGVLNASFARVDLTRLSVRRPFDVVLAMECLVEIPDDRAALGALAGALRQDGTFLAHLPVHDWTPVLPGSAATWRHEARHGYDPVKLPSLLREAGLELRTVIPSQRGTVTVAQELRDRWKQSSPALRLLTAPVMTASARLDTAGVTWGPARGLLLTASPVDPTTPSAAG
jgi:SAM-dependent methyltransferase